MTSTLQETKDYQYKKENISILVILIVLFINFYDFQPLWNTFSIIKLIVIIPLFLYCLSTIITSRGIFSLPIKLIIGSILFSLFTARFSWGQSFWQSFREIPYYMGYLLYFFLIRKDISEKKLEKIILIFSILYIVLYIFQFINYDHLVFGAWTTTGTSRGIIRILFSGEGFMFFGIAYFFDKVLKGERRYFYISVLSAFLIIMFMQVTRQYILAVGVMVLFGLMRKSKIYLKVLAVLLVIIATNIYQYSSNPMIEGMRADQEADIELKDDYIRVIAGNYFLTELAPDKFAAIFGNGIPSYSSEYGKEYYTNLTAEEGFFFDDLGLIGGYALFGIIYVIGYLMIAYKTIRYNPGYEGEYLRYYILMIFVMSLTSRSVLGNGFVVPTVMVLYLYERYYCMKLEENEND